MKNYEILLVDDDPSVLTVIASILERRGYQVTRASGGEVAIDALRMKDFDLVITDLNMPETGGIAIVKKAKELNPDRGVIILTGSGDAALVAEALRAGADDYMLKPCKPTELWRRMDNCLQRSEVKRRKKKESGDMRGRFQEFKTREFNGQPQNV